MKQTPRRAIRDGLKYLNETYGFLLERGYEVVSAENISLGWRVVFRKPDLIVRIERVRGEEDISFRTGTRPPEEAFDLGSVVYAATGEKIPLSAYDDLSNELQKYLGRIETYFSDEYARDVDGLRAAQQEYRKIFSSGEVAFPEEPKRIPILHYPLMGIIILLIFGALTTLYMALLDRLLSAFALDSDSYGIVMGAGAILLASGTMFLFRRLTPKS